MNSLASTFKVSCKLEDKVYECKSVEKREYEDSTMEKEGSFDLLFKAFKASTLQQRAVQFFRTPKQAMSSLSALRRSSSEG